MDDETARTLLREERQRVERLIAQTRADSASDQAEASQTGDIADPAERLTAEQVDDALVEGLQARLDAITRAEQRLDAGTYGRSIRSGQAIPEERLQADPAAELTREEAAVQE